MQLPTPEQERDYYAQALQTAAPIISAMDIDQQTRLVTSHYQVTNEMLDEYHATGTLPLQALTAMADMVWESIMGFKSSQDMTLSEFMAEYDHAQPGD